MTKRCGVLGATGMVGQRFVLLLSNHPFFTLHKLGASERSTGKRYLSATKWRQSTSCPSSAANMQILECSAENFSDCDLVFSGLDSSVAGEIGTLLN